MKITPTGIAVALAVVIALGFLFFGPALLTPFAPSAPSDQSSTTPQDEAAVTGIPAGDTGDAGAPTTTNKDGLMITDTVVGTGDEAVPGKTVTVRYVGKLTDGTVFDASDNHPETKAGFTFALGAGQVIKGWDEGVAGMKVGGTRHLVIPPDMGYGAQAVGPIPANSTLVFDVELLSVQ